MTKVYFQSFFNTTKTQELQQICIKTAKKKKKQTIKQEISILLFHVLSISVLSGGSFLHTSQMLGFFSKLEHTCFEVTDVLLFLEILYHLPYCVCLSGRYKFLPLSFTRPSFQYLNSHGGSYKEDRTNGIIFLAHARKAEIFVTGLL